MKTKLIVVAGPTAVGKTALGIELAKRFNGEIISGDSQQVYRQLNIGTAKATPEEQAAAVHHLIDVRDVDESYSAYDFVTEAEVAITDIVSRGKLPIVVGGTGLYLQSLLEGYHLGGQVDQDQVLAYRTELEQLSDQELFDNYPNAQSARGIGYKELFPYFAGNQTLDEALEKLKQNTRRFAKRQLTWFRNRMTVKFYQISSPEYPENVVQDLELFLNEREGEKVGQS